MKQVPPWKIRRELRRVGKQALDLPVELARKAYFRRWYDLIGSRKIKFTEGSVPFGSEMCIYLIYPSSGLLGSHLFAIDEIRRSDISPVVVSNLPLEEPDRTLLSDRAALIIERPNIGYDFGGYRDGILALKHRLAALDRLWLMNDSVWMIPQPTSWFEEARMLGVDFAAATSNYAMPRVDVNRFREITWNYRTDRRNFHYASYALCIGSRVLNDPGFIGFWERLDIRNDKKRTVRRGEIGFSQWVLRKGYSHRATCEVDTLDVELEALTTTEIDELARKIVIPEDARLAALKAQLLTGGAAPLEDRADKIAFILTAVSRQASAYALPAYTIPRRVFQFLKKAPLCLAPDAAETSLGIIQAISNPNSYDLMGEANALLRSEGKRSPSGSTATRRSK